MKTLTIILLLISASLSGFSQTTTYQLTPSKSSISWTGYGEIGGYSLSGTLGFQQGSFEFEGDQVTKGQFEVDMNTISHEDKSLVKHLKNKDFFHVKKFPSATFECTGMEDSVVSGFITIKDVRKEISFPVKMTREGDVTTFSGNIEIDRTEFGIYYNSTSFFQNLGNSAIKNKFELTFTLVAEAKT